METLNVIKIGGNVIDEPVMLQGFLKMFSSIPGKKVLVHGGGKAANKLSRKLGIEPIMREGRRITDEATLDVVVMVYAGLINKSIVAGLQSNDCNAIGLCGADAGIIPSNKRISPSVDFGCVGDVDPVKINIVQLNMFMDNGLVPVLCSITHDKDWGLLNTNADTIASVVAIALSEKYKVKLTYCFERMGILKDLHDESSLLSSINEREYKE
jgi:acetylglutamate kinase